MISQTPPARKIAWKWIGLGAGIVALIAVGRGIPVNEWLKQFDQSIESAGLWGLVIYALVYALATVLFIPGSVITLGAGFTFGLLRGTVAVSLGSTLGAALAFLIARYLARKKISAWAGKNEKFEAIDRAIGEQGWKIIALLRLSPLIPFNVSNYLYGLTAVRFWPYLAASWVAMIPGTLLYVYLGAAGKAGLKAAAGQGSALHSLQTIFLIMGLVATLVVTWFVSRIARGALQKARLREGETK